MKRKILLPTDFSDNAWSATVYALNLFAKEECTFYFLNSVTIKENMLTNVSTKIIKEIADNETQELIDLKALAENSQPNPKHSFETILSPKDLNTAIKDAVEKYDINLLIMGTKGATGIKEFFFGSNTMRVVTSIKDCPILIIPEEYDFIKPKQIAFPTDFNRFYHLNEIKQLKYIADLYNSKVRVLHINEEKELNETQKDNLVMLETYLNNNDFSLHWMPKYTEKAKEIDDFIEELNIDILVMVKYKHSLTEKILNEPVIKDIGFHTKIPFLIIPG